MLNSFLSKASRGTNESSSEEQERIEESMIASSTLSTNQLNNEATGVYPSPGSSPYHLEEDEDDAPVLVARCPPVSQVPHVGDGSLTYDNLQTPSDITDGANDPTKKGQDDNADIVKKMDEVLGGVVDTAKKVDGVSFEDKTLTAVKLFADSVIVEPNSNETGLAEEVKDPLMLSLHASDLDISAIKDLTLTTPSNVNDFVTETEVAREESDKRTSDLHGETVGEDAKLPPKSVNEPIQPEKNESKSSKTGRLLGCSSRRLLLLPFLLGTPLVFYAALTGMSPALPPSVKGVLMDSVTLDTVPMSSSSHTNNIDSSESDVKTGNLEVLPMIRSGSVIKERDSSATAGNTTLPVALAEEEEILAVNKSNMTEKLMIQEETELPDTRSRISVSVATDDTPTIKSTITDRFSQEFPSLKADDNASCHGSHWSGGMTMPQLFLLGVLLLASTTSMFGSKRSNEESSIKEECPLSPQVKKELGRYDLSKYFDDHSVAQLREKLRSRKCNTTGKKHKLAQRLAAVYKAELETLTVVQLRKILKSKNFTQYGTKAEIIRVLVEECP